MELFSIRIQRTFQLVSTIVLFTRQYHKINGIDFSNPEAWERMEAMISKYVDFIFDNNL